MDLIYFDPECAGYHPGHIKIFVDRASSDERISSLHFVLAPNFRDYDMLNILDTIQTQPKLSFEYCRQSVADACSPTSNLRARARGLVRWSEMRNILRQRPGAVLFDSLFDTTLIGAALDRRSTPGRVTGIVMFCSPALLSADWNERWKLRTVYWLARRREIPVVLSFDKNFVENGPRSIVRNWRWIPDPLPVTAQQFQRLASAPPPPARDRVEFLLFGSLGRRKGLFATLDALERLDPATARQVRVRILGKLSEGDASELDCLRRTVTRIQSEGIVDLQFDDRFVTEDELIDRLIECDVVLAPYLHHPGFSSVIFWAAAAGRPVITQNTGWIALDVGSNQLGILCDPSRVEDLAAAFSKMVMQDRLAAWPASRLRKFVAAHSPDRFYASIVENIDAIDCQ